MMILKKVNIFMKMIIINRVQRTYWNIGKIHQEITYKNERILKEKNEDKFLPSF